MGSKSDYLEGKLLDHVLGNTAYSPGATLYVALGTGSPSDSAFGAEPNSTWTNYARVAVTNNTTNWPNASGGSKSNGTDITWSSAVTGSATLTCVGIFDSATIGGGNMLYWGTLGTSKAVSAGDTVSILTGALTITED